MLLQSKSLSNAPVMSLHTGHAIGHLAQPIIDPHNLEVIGFYVGGEANDAHPEQLIVLTRDFRDISPRRCMVNSSDELTSANDLHKYKDVLDLNFHLIDKRVKTESKKRLGKIDDFVINTESFAVQKLYVSQSLLKSFGTHSLIIDRSQVVSVTDSEVIVADAVNTKPAPAIQQQPAA